MYLNLKTAESEKKNTSPWLFDNLPVNELARPDRIIELSHFAWSCPQLDQNDPIRSVLFRWTSLLRTLTYFDLGSWSKEPNNSNYSIAVN